MTQFKTETYVAQETAANRAGNMIGTAELISGKSAFLQCKVTVPAGTATNDTLLVGFLPSGMSVVPGATITTVTAAGAGSFTIGTGDDTIAIAEEVDAGQIGTAHINVVPSFKSTKREDIVLTLNSPLTAGGVFYLNFPLVNSN